MNLFMSHPRSVSVHMHVYGTVSPRMLMRVCACVCVCLFPYSQHCKCSFMVFQTFVFLIYFTSKGHMERAGGLLAYGL